MELKLPDASTNTPNGVFGHPDADAANGLFMLAQSNGARSGNQFAVSQAEPSASSSMAGAVQPPQPQASSRGAKRSISSEDQDDSDSDESEVAPKPATRSRGKKPAAESKAANGRRKADTPAKGSAAKRQKALPKDEDEGLDEGPSTGKDGKKMTDEEKRKNFLERNR